MRIEKTYCFLVAKRKSYSTKVFAYVRRKMITFQANRYTSFCSTERVGRFIWIEAREKGDEKKRASKEKEDEPYSGIAQKNLYHPSSRITKDSL